jgi:hypothetical protein
VDSWRRLLYVFDRGQIVGLRVAGLLNTALLLSALVAVLRRPGPAWVLAALLVAAAASLWLLVRRERSRSFIRFVEEPFPLPAPRRLALAEKIPLYVTGALGVQGKLRPFTELPAFYRTFGTREHALLCQAQARRWGGIVGWPEDELGLWYAFFLPDQITAIRVGWLQGSRTGDPALAVTYRQAQAPQGAGNRPPRSQPESKWRPPLLATVYLAFPTAEDRQAVLADLLVDATEALRAHSAPQETPS